MAPNEAEVKALTSLLEEAGLSSADLLTAITTLAKAKEVAKADRDKEDSGEKKNVRDKELVYADETAIIYRRGDTKANTYYFRTYDNISGKQYVKSLGTTDRVKALATARNLFQQVKGKIEKCERLKSINTIELVERYREYLRQRISDKPHIGITEGTYKLKDYFLKVWFRYVCQLGLEKTPIDRIPKNKFIDFGLWFQKLPKESGDTTKARSEEQVNNAIACVGAMYKAVAVRDRFISSDKVPEIDRVKEPKDTTYKKDILTLEQYEKLWKYLEYTYCKGKGENKLKPNEIEKRKVFSKAIGILYNTGLRPKELLGLYWHEVTPMEGELKDTHMKVFIRQENSKNGKSRLVVAPIKRRVEVIRQAYKDMGVELQPTDFIFLNPMNKDRKQYTRQNYVERLNRVLDKSGLAEELAKVGKRLSLYSSRHFFITMRLRYGKVPLYLLSKAVGTSVSNITDVYGNISVEAEAATLTKNMGRLIQSGVDMDKEISVLET